ncbi:aspartate kinase [candidate division KSB1 bacterium]|nr:aspartate kinase [candidate division KSB1 bacterium]
MKIIVQKYGGSSISTPEKIIKVAKRILELAEMGKAIAVVVSAMGDTTDRLIEMAKDISPNPPYREMDMLMATGEQVSIALLSMAINNLGGTSVSLTGAQSGIVTDGRHRNAKIKKVKIERIMNLFKEGKVVIVAGFQGISSESEITTLGRGGSDTSAAALAAALNADCCEILTDVEGVYTADPNIVNNAAKLNYISYEEMLEFAGSGAKVLHPRAVEIVMKFGIPLVVKSAHTPGNGTTIVEDKMLERVAVTGVTVDRNVAKIAIQKVPDTPGIAATIFSAISKTGINIRLIIQGISDGKYSDITMLSDKEDMESVVKVLERVCPKIKAGGVTFNDGMAEVSVIGSGIASSTGVAAKIFKTLSDNNINIDSISTSHIRIACVIDQQKVETAVKAIHRAFKLEELIRKI